jgi:hypothetical protein
MKTKYKEGDRVWYDGKGFDPGILHKGAYTIHAISKYTISSGRTAHYELRPHCSYVYHTDAFDKHTELVTNMQEALYGN